MDNHFLKTLRRDETFKIPDAIEPVVGYRVWVPNFECGPRLESTTGGLLTAWHPDTRTSAQCRYTNRHWDCYYCSHYLRCTKHEDVGSHAAPHEDCSCGLYAFRTPEGCLSEFKPGVYGMRNPVYGVVHLWGKIVTHAHGWRAQYAKIVAIDGARSPDADIFSWRYQVPIINGMESYGR